MLEMCPILDPSRVAWTQKLLQPLRGPHVHVPLETCARPVSGRRARPCRRPTSGRPPRLRPTSGRPSTRPTGGRPQTGRPRPVSGKSARAEAIEVSKQTLGSAKLSELRVRREEGDLQEAVAMRSTMVGIWRGVLDGEMDDFDAECAELASYRSACRREEQRRCRQRASQWRAGQERECCLGSLRTQLRSAGLECHREARQTPERISRATTLRFEEIQPERTKLLETSLRPKQSLEARLTLVKQRGQDRRRAAEDEKWVKAAERANFRNKQPVVSHVKSAKDRDPNSEAFQLFTQDHSSNRFDEFQHVFSQYDGDGSGRLDRNELRACLADVGLQGKSIAERQEIRKILNASDQMEIDFAEFMMRIVPAVRAKLIEAKMGKLRELFTQADVDESGLLSINELINQIRLLGTFPSDDGVLEAIQELAPDVEQRCRSMEGAWLREREAISFEQFSMLVPLLQERQARLETTRFREISDELELTPAEREMWQDNLLELHTAFHRFETRGEKEVVRVLREHGLTPRYADPASQALPVTMQLQRIVGNDLAQAGSGFKQFLKMADKLRRHDRLRLEQIFTAHDINGDCTLGVTEVQHALKECMILPKSPLESEELQNAVDEFDDDNSGEVDVEEFVNFCFYASERLRRLRREEERQLGARCGYDERRLEELRDAFTTLDDNMNEALEGQEVVLALELLRRNATREELDLLLAEVGLDPKNPASKLDFKHFIELMSGLDQLQALGHNAWLASRKSLARKSTARLSQPARQV